MVSTTEWLITIIALLAILTFDFTWAIKNRNKETSMREVLMWTAFYVSLAIGFGISLGGWIDSQAQQEFFAGWLTEYSLSFDNLFVFVIILTKLKISKERQQLALLIGIVIALVLRIIAISVGAAVIARFEAVFFVFGAFLLYTAIQLYAESTTHGEDEKESGVIRVLQERGVKPFTIALIALGMTDLLFALDSIPAIFGLTQNVYIVITANVFALMGLRQLYFLIGGLMERLIHIGRGLSVVLGFIGIKLIFHACHAVGWHEIAGIHIPEITITQSLSVIVLCIGTATVTSLIATRKKA
jgi:tellurite resistance protein TerC